MVNYLKRLIILVIKLLGLHTSKMASAYLNVHISIILKEINKGNIKPLNVFGNYLFWRSSLIKLKSRVGDNLIYDINIDDLNFRMTFHNYSLGYAINERIEGIREPSTTAAIRSIVREGSNILELGGCYGYFTNIMSNCTGKNGKVVSIEGTPNNFNIIKDNVKLNKLDNVELHQVFISDDSGNSEVCFDIDERSPYGVLDTIRNGEPFENLENKIVVPCVKVSSFLDEIDFIPDHIFMDIEGCEIDVFQDFARGYLKNNRPTIVFEIHEMFYSQEKNLNFIKSILNENNYYFRHDTDNLICFPNR